LYTCVGQISEEAKYISSLVLLLGQAYIYPLNPGVKDLPIKQRAVAIALSVAITKPGLEHLGRGNWDGLPPTLPLCMEKCGYVMATMDHTVSRQQTRV
jgi:hypothetical protein